DEKAIRERLETGVMSSVVAEEDGRVVGHLAIDRDSGDQMVGESAHATVDPSERGKHIFERLKVYMAEVASKDGLLGLYSEATAAHPFSQKGNLAIGAHEMGFLLGYIPSGVAYSGIDADESHRLSVAVMYLRTNEEPEREVHVPEEFAETATQIY